jgi:hypothetical protein
MIDGTIKDGKTVAGGRNSPRKAVGRAPKGKVNANMA